MNAGGEIKEPGLYNFCFQREMEGMQGDVCLWSFQGSISLDQTFQGPKGEKKGEKKRKHALVGLGKKKNRKSLYLPDMRVVVYGIWRDDHMGTLEVHSVVTQFVAWGEQAGCRRRRKHSQGLLQHLWPTHRQHIYIESLYD